MKSYLSKSYSSVNSNKIHGILAEIDFRRYLDSLGFGNRVSVGGWIGRCTGATDFSKNVIVMFPQTIQPDVDYSESGVPSNLSFGLHTICSTFHQIGIHGYYCWPVISSDDPADIRWRAIQLGIPAQGQVINFPEDITGFSRRERRYNFLRYHSDISRIPVQSVPEEFSKENIRISFHNYYMAEISDVDGILWGNQFTYPLEIKEKTAATDSRMGEYFGLDVGPFVKLSFYAAKRGNLHSIFIVREIDNPEDRNLVNWLYISFEKLARYAGWTPGRGGTNMQGGASSVIKIPKSQFDVLDAEAINSM